MTDKKGNKKKKRGGGNGSKKKTMMTHEQRMAYKCTSEWVFLENNNNINKPTAHENTDDGFGVINTNNTSSSNKSSFSEKLVFEMHCHSICSDGFLSPFKVVERAHLNGVKVLALTDHDTMAGVPEALDAARKFGIKIIPGVEISTIYSPRGENGLEEPVHILAYYSSCGPMRSEELDKLLASIRDGRYLRAKNMISKLNKLKLPVKWEHVAKIAGNGVAPGRLHVARAMVEAGHVENLKQAFARYLYDGGPAYSTGSEPSAEEAVKLICETGGVAVLAHPWALKNPAPIVRSLKDAGLHGIEVYRSDGKLSAYSDLAFKHNLIMLGGSDFHGRGGHHESNLGSVNIPVLSLHEFLKIARPIWCNSIRDVLENYADDPSLLKLEQIMKFAKSRQVKGESVAKSINDLIDICLSSWLTVDERKISDFEAVRLKLIKTHS